MPGYCTVLSTLVCPSKSWTALCPSAYRSASPLSVATRKSRTDLCPTLPIHSETRRAYWRVVMLRPGPRWPVNKNSPSPCRWPLANHRLPGGSVRSIQIRQADRFSFAKRSRDPPYIRLRRHPQFGGRRHRSHGACCRLPEHGEVTSAPWIWSFVRMDQTCLRRNGGVARSA